MVVNSIQNIPYYKYHELKYQNGLRLFDTCFTSSTKENINLLKNQISNKSTAVYFMNYHIIQHLNNYTIIGTWIWMHQWRILSYQRSRFDTDMGWMNTTAPCMVRWVIYTDLADSNKRRRFRPPGIPAHWDIHFQRSVLTRTPIATNTILLTVRASCLFVINQ